MALPDIKDIVAQYQWFQDALDALLAEPIRPLPALPPKFGIGSSAVAELQRSFEKLAIRYHELRREIDASRLPPEGGTRPPASPDRPDRAALDWFAGALQALTAHPPHPLPPMLSDYGALSELRPLLEKVAVQHFGLKTEVDALRAMARARAQGDDRDDGTLQGEVQSLRDTQRLAQDLSAATEQMGLVQDENATLRDQLDVATRENADLIQRLEVHARDSREREADHARLSQEHKTALARHRALEEQIHLLEARVHEMQAAAERAREHAQHEQRALCDTIRSLTEANARLGTAQEDSQGANQALRRQLEALSEEHDQLAVSHRAMETALREELARERAALQEQLAHALETARASQAEAQRRAQEHAAAAEELAASLQQHEVLQRRVEELAADRARLTEASNRLSDQHMVLQEQLKTLTQRHVGLQEEMAALVEAKRVQDQSCADLSARLSETAASLHALQSHEEEFAALRLTYEALASAHGRLQDEQRRALATIERLTLELAEKQAELERVIAAGRQPAPRPDAEPSAVPVEDRSPRDVFLETLKRELAASTDRLRQEAQERVRLAFHSDR